MTVSSTYSFIDPIRLYKENDPYYWELDNIPLNQLQSNVLWLKDQVEGLSNQGSITRSAFSELKPYVNSVDNIVRVKPGRYTGRVNDAYNKTPMQKLALLNTVVGGDIRQYRSVFGLSSFNEIVNKLYSDSGASSLSMNGLTEAIYSWRITSPDEATGTTAIGTKPSTGSDVRLDLTPVVHQVAYSNSYVQVAGSFTDLNRLSAEFCKQWRGIARTAIVDIPEELSVTVPAFDENDFKRQAADGINYEVIPNSVVRIDLVFVYTHPIDTSSTTIIKYSNGTPQTITQPTLGLLKGAGAIIQRPGGLGGVGIVQNPTDTNGNPQIVANVADQYNTGIGFDTENVRGSFPSPDDLMNIAPNLIENLESTDYQLIGQSILPICYVVVRRGASLNAAGEAVLTDTDIIDIRPFFRTAELSYNERAGIAAASPALSFANPAVGQAQLDFELNQLKSRLEAQITTVAEDKPRTVAGGIVWGGTKFGPEGAIRLAAELLVGINQANLPFSDAPTYPDWDVAEWWSIYNGTGSSGGGVSLNTAGTKRNDRVNFIRKEANRPFDSGTNPSNAADISTASRFIGNQHFNGATSNPYCIYWVKKEILIDRSSVPWMEDYTVECQLLNCIPQTHKSTKSGNSFHDDDSGSAGVWVEKKFDRFYIYVAWMADSPNTYVQDGGIPHGREPRLDRDTAGFSGFVVRASDMGLPSTDNMQYDQSNSKGPRIGACTYPTVSFKVTGYPSSYFYKSMSQYPQVSLITLK